MTRRRPSFVWKGSKKGGLFRLDSRGKINALDQVRANNGIAWTRGDQATEVKA